VDLVRIDVSEECVGFFIAVQGISEVGTMLAVKYQLPTADAVPSSLIVFTLMMMAIRF
jgi:hypothetical protein